MRFISPESMLWTLHRITSLRLFSCVTTMFSWRNKKNIQSLERVEETTARKHYFVQHNAWHLDGIYLYIFIVHVYG